MKGYKQIKIRHELRFGNRHLALFIASIIIIWGLIFILGVLVGRNITLTKISDETRSKYVKVVDKDKDKKFKKPPGAVEKDVVPQEKLTFYDSLTAPRVEVPKAKFTTKVEGKIVEAPPKESKAREKEIVKKSPIEAKVKTEIKSRAEEQPSKVTQGMYTIQVSSFRNKNLAEELKSSLVSKGYNAYIVPVETQDGRMRYRIRVGSFTSRAEAERLAEKLKTERNLNPFVILRGK